MPVQLTKRACGYGREGRERGNLTEAPHQQLSLNPKRVQSRERRMVEGGAKPISTYTIGQSASGLGNGASKVTRRV
jgi:hypothetical protein